VTPPALSEFEGVATIVSLVARGIGIAIMPRLAVAGGAATAGGGGGGGLGGVGPPEDRGASGGRPPG